jgi:hypothetical protein
MMQKEELQKKQFIQIPS